MKIFSKKYLNDMNSKFKSNKLKYLPLDWDIKVCDISEAKVYQFL